MQSKPTHNLSRLIFFDKMFILRLKSTQLTDKSPKIIDKMRYFIKKHYKKLTFKGKAYLYSKRNQIGLYSEFCHAIY